MHDASTPPMGGEVSTGFGAVRTAFEKAVADSAAGGAALCVMIDGKTVVDLWGGYADTRTAALWVASTSSVFFSMTKGLLALLVARLVEAGLIDLDARMTTYWPEFGQASKESVTMRQVMSHRAGLSYPVKDISRRDLLDWDPIITLLQEQEPLWAPGSAHQYHALTYGWLVGEVIRRVTGLSVSDAFDKYLVAPISAEAWIGVPEDQLARVARLVPAPEMNLDLPEGFSNGLQMQRSLTLGGAFPMTLAGDKTGMNDPAIQRAAIPGGNGIGTARAVASLWSSAIVPTATTHPISAAVLDDMMVTRSSGEPLWPVPALGFEAWGTGFNVASELQPMFGLSSFGHGGAGGQMSFADRDHELAFAFLTSDLKIVDDRRTATLLEALHGCV